MAGASLVAAVPGAVLSALLVIALLNNLESIPTKLLVLIILVLLVAAAAALFPAWALIMFRATPYELPAGSPLAATSNKKGSTAAPTVAAPEVDEEFSPAEGDEFATSDEFSEFEEHGDALSGNEFESFDEDASGGDSFDSDFNFEEFDEEEGKK
ncbi:hypothetical protein [Planctomicrobium sp. SH664]|uniref:hypothetical protein n=1 Tax=Planctomicrobium sp. SH664 TaxID=3448125 RepID=UPI003F5BE56E